MTQRGFLQPIELARDTATIAGELIFLRLPPRPKAGAELRAWQGLLALSLKLRDAGCRRNNARRDALTLWRIRRSEALTGVGYLIELLRYNDVLSELAPVITERGQGALSAAAQQACIDVFSVLLLALTERRGRRPLSYDAAKRVIAEYNEHRDAELRTYAKRLEDRLQRVDALAAESSAPINPNVLERLLRLRLMLR